MTSQIEQEKAMFGCIRTEIDQMLAMSVLSDAQELIARENGEEARKHINIAKYITQKTAVTGGQAHDA